MVILEIAIVFLLVVLNGFFAMSELAIVSARRGRLQQRARDGDAGAALAMRLAADPGRFLSSVQIGITLIGVLSGAFSGATLGEPLGAWLDTISAIAPYGTPIGIAIVVAAVTYLSLVIGELVPKQLALAAAEPIAARVARPLRIVAALGSPLVSLLELSTNSILAALGTRPRRGHVVTEEEIRNLVAEGAEAGVFGADEERMVASVLRLDERPVRSIMTPRTQVVWLNVADDARSIAAQLRRTTHSRLVVSRGSIDDVLGIVRKGDMLDQILEGRTLDVSAVLRAAPVILGGMPILRLIEAFKTSRRHLAIVVDEYGGLQGVVTPIDILETIAGRLSGPPEESEPEVVRREDGSLLIDGALDLHEVQQLLSAPDMRHDRDFHTLAGFVLHHLGRIPRAGDAFVWTRWRFEVVDMDGRRIDKVLVSSVPPR